MLLAPAKDACDPFAALLRHALARVPCRAGIDRASPPLADFGRAIVLRHMRRDVDGTQIFHMALRIIGLVRAGRAAPTNGLALGFSMACEARRFAGPSALVTPPGRENPRHLLPCRRRPWPESSSAMPRPRSKSHPPKNARPTKAASPAGDSKTWS